MDIEHESGCTKLCLDALEQIKSAIESLDRANAPGHIAAHLDLATHQLRDFIDTVVPHASFDQIERKAAPQ
nr:hypothetical protein [Sphingomonas sp.]